MAGVKFNFGRLDSFFERWGVKTVQADPTLETKIQPVVIVGDETESVGTPRADKFMLGNFVAAGGAGQLGTAHFAPKIPTQQGAPPALAGIIVEFSWQIGPLLTTNISVHMERSNFARPLTGSAPTLPIQGRMCGIGAGYLNPTLWESQSGTGVVIAAPALLWATPSFGSPPPPAIFVPQGSRVVFLGTDNRDFGWTAVVTEIPKDGLPSYRYTD